MIRLIIFYCIVFFLLTPAISLENYVLIQEKLGQTLEKYPIQIGRVFMPGEILHDPQASLDGILLPTQADIKNRWSDGSVKYAILSFIVPKLGAFRKAKITFVDQIQNGNSALSIAEMLNSGFDFDAKMEFQHNGLTIVVSAREMLKDPYITYWTKGKICTTILLKDHSTQRKFDIGFDSHRSIRPLFYISFWPEIKQVRVRFIAEICNTECLQDQSYRLQLSIGYSNPSLVYTSKSELVHCSMTRWTKEFWLPKELPALQLDPNLAYLRQTKAFPNYDITKKISEITIHNAWMDWQQSSHDLYEPGNWTKSMPDTGGRAEIGPYPTWAVQWLYTGDPRLAQKTLGNADLAGAWPMHIREGNGSKFFDAPASIPGIGKIVSLYGRPTFWSARWLTWHHTSAQDKVVPVGPVSDGGWIPDNAHQPDPFSIPYVLTGDFWYLEQLYFWATWAALNENHEPEYAAGRGPLGCAGISGEIRAQAWTLRTRARAAYFAPDFSPEKAYFTQMMHDAIAVWEGQRDISLTQYAGNRNWTWGNQIGKRAVWNHEGQWEGPISPISPLRVWARGSEGHVNTAGISPDEAAEAVSPWQIHFVMFSLGHAKELGFATDALIEWLSPFVVQELTHPDYDPYLVANSRIATISKTGKFFSTWAEVRKTIPPSYDFKQDFENTRLDAEHGYAIIVIPAIAMAQYSSFSQKSKAWQWIVENCLWSPTLSENPKWAIVPRIE